MLINVVLKTIFAKGLNVENVFPYIVKVFIKQKILQLDDFVTNIPPF